MPMLISRLDFGVWRKGQGWYQLALNVVGQRPSALGSVVPIRW